MEADGDALSVGGLEVGEQVDEVGRALIVSEEGEGRGADRVGGGGAGFGGAAGDFDERAGGIRRRGDVEQAPDAFVSEVGVDASDGLAGGGVASLSPALDSVPAGREARDNSEKKPKGSAGGVEVKPREASLPFRWGHDGILSSSGVPLNGV